MKATYAHEPRLPSSLRHRCHARPFGLLPRCSRTAGPSLDVGDRHRRLLREITPQVARVGIVREVEGQAGIAQWAVIGAAASPLGVELSPINVQVDGDTEGAVAEFARDRSDGLIVVVSSTSTIQRDLLVKLAARHRLPAVYPYRFFVDAGGLISYGPNLLDGYRRSASYVDRILRGEKPADLPVQAPTKYELVINMKTAKALGLQVPPTLLARADEVIE
jgi:putative tryptophan/tyrosine transport system substrate-binding protein